MPAFKTLSLVLIQISSTRDGDGTVSKKLAKNRTPGHKGFDILVRFSSIWTLSQHLSMIVIGVNIPSHVKITRHIIMRDLTLSSFVLIFETEFLYSEDVDCMKGKCQGSHRCIFLKKII